MKTDKISRKDQENLILKFRNDICLFVEVGILEPYNKATGSNYFITHQQREGLKAVQDLVEAKCEGKAQDKLGVSIMSGKGCHAKGTHVMMSYGGCRKVEDIQVGDKLMGDDNTPRTVLSLKSGREQMYRINLSDGSSYDVNESHILSLRCCETGQRGSLKWGKILNVTVKEYLTWSDRKKKSYCAYKVPVEFEQAEVKIPAYILGCWIGDGSSDSARLINKDKAVIKEWIDYGERIGLNYKCYNKIDHRLTGSNRSNAFMEKLRSYNLVNNKHIPADYLLNSRKNRLELLAGLIDTDGCVTKKGAYRYSTNNLKLAEDVLYLVRSLGFRGVLLKNERFRGHFKKKLQVEYTVGISRGDTEAIPVRIDYKKAVQSKRKDLNFTFTVEKLDIDNYYGFELDGNHLYLLSDFSVTHNTGKDALTAWIIKWFMWCFPSPKIPCVSVSADQLNKVLWSELAKWLAHADPIIKNVLVLQTDKLFRKDVPEDVRGKKWFAYTKAANPKSSPDEQVETLAGQHEDYLLQIVDEGSGVLNPVYDVLENNMTGFCNLMLIIFNPMHAKGYALDTQYKNREDWVTLQWNSEESEITNKEKHRKLAKRFGKDSNPYRMNVLGLPPLFDSDTLLNWDWIMDAVDRQMEIPAELPLVFGVDCGGGGDMSIIASRRGNRVMEFKRKKSNDSVELVNWIGHEIDVKSPDCVRVDTIGLGWHIEGDLRNKKGAIVEAADVRRTADNSDRFANKRAEMYWNLREKFEKGVISIPDDEELKNQLSVIKYSPDKRGRTVIMEKHDIKKELGRSPDEADATALLYYREDEMLSIMRSKRRVRSKPKHWQAA